MNIDLYSTYHNKQAYVLACRIYSNKVGWLLLAPTSYPSNNENASLSFHAKYYDSNFSILHEFTTNAFSQKHVNNTCEFPSIDRRLLVMLRQLTKLPTYAVTIVHSV